MSIIERHIFGRQPVRYMNDRNNYQRERKKGKKTETETENKIRYVSEKREILIKVDTEMSITTA